MTRACVRVPVSSFVAFRVHFSQWFVSWTKHYLTLGLAVGKEHVQAVDPAVDAESDPDMARAEAAPAHRSAQCLAPDSSGRLAQSSRRAARAAEAREGAAQSYWRCRGNANWELRPIEVVGPAVDSEVGRRELPGVL
jgi:hypothetical protein